MPLPLIIAYLSPTAFVSIYEVETKAGAPKTNEVRYKPELYLDKRGEAEQRNYSSHLSSLLGFTGKLLTLSIFYLINGTVSLVADIIKSNEVSNG